MSVCAMRLDGPAITLLRSRRERPTEGQMRNRRNAMWLQAVEGAGKVDEHGKLRRFTVAELAELYGLSKQTIRNGIETARKILHLRDSVRGS